MPADHQEDPHERALDRLRYIAHKYEHDPFVIAGVDEDAEQENAMVISALESLEKEFRGQEDRIFAVMLAGSRIQGFNKEGSDVDIFFVEPEGDALPDAMDRINAVLKKRGLPQANSNIRLWMEFRIPASVDGFVDFVDHYEQKGDDQPLVTLFGYAAYENPNLRLTQLALVELLGQREDGGTLAWGKLQQAYSNRYFGDQLHRDRTIVKIASRLGLKSREVEAILTPALFEERKAKFGLEDLPVLTTRLHSWYNRNKKKLASYHMASVYQKILERISQGF